MKGVPAKHPLPRVIGSGSISDNDCYCRIDRIIGSGSKPLLPERSHHFSDSSNCLIPSDILTPALGKVLLSSTQKEKEYANIY